MVCLDTILINYLLSFIFTEHNIKNKHFLSGKQKKSSLNKLKIFKRPERWCEIKSKREQSNAKITRIIPPLLRQLPTGGTCHLRATTPTNKTTFKMKIYGGAVKTQAKMFEEARKKGKWGDEVVWGL